MDHCSLSRDLAISRALRQLERRREKRALIGSITVFILISAHRHAQERASARMHDFRRAFRTQSRSSSRAKPTIWISLREMPRFLSTRKT